MAKENRVPVEYHLKFNERNPRHINSALALASVNRRYKSSFIALAIEYYMQTHPLGISQTELLDMYRQSDRTYQPKTPISANLTKTSKRPAAVPVTEGAHDDAATSNAIDKAMDFYDV
jgi:hypothetical protein